MSTNISLGSGRIEVSLSELRRMKASAESLINEIKSRVANVITKARLAANTASAEFGALVSTQSNAVARQCDTLADASSDAIRELDALVKGLDQAIEGYISLENTLAAPYGLESRREVTQWTI